MSTKLNRPGSSRRVHAHTDSATGQTRAAVGRGKSVKHVYETLRAEILSLKLAPGEDIDDAALCQRLGLSRTPIREALSRLLGDGLIVQLPNRGMQVAPLNLLDMLRYAEALALLQRAVMRAAAMRHTTKDLARIEECYEAFVIAADDPNPVELTLVNRAFHVAIAAASHNHYLAEGYTRLLDEGMRMLSVPFAYDPAPDDSARAHTRKVGEEHREMVEVIRAGDANRAEALGAEHADLFRRRFIAYLEKNFLEKISVAEIASAEQLRPLSNY